MAYFKVYKDFINVAQELDNGQRGRLFLAILQYVNDEEPEILTGAERIAFVTMKSQIDRDRAALAATSEAKSEAGKKGAEARWKNKQPIANDGKAILPLTDDGKNGYNKDKEKDKEKNKEKEKRKKESVGDKSPTARAYFVPPSVEDVAEYCRERRNSVDPQRFVDFYAAKGWMVGKNKMKDWKACVRTWEQRDGEENSEKKTHAIYNSETLQSLMDIEVR